VVDPDKRRRCDCGGAFVFEVDKAIMAEINKLSVEKALEKLRASDAKHSKDVIFNDSVAALIEEIKRIRAQELRLQHHQRKRDKDSR
jgi:hypothetical protein